MFKFFKSKDYLNFLKFHKIFFFLSFIIIMISFASFFINKLNFGIDFTGGLLFDISVDNVKNEQGESDLISEISNLRNVFIKNGFDDFNIQNYGDNGIIIRISEKEINKQVKKELSNSESIKIVKGIIQTSFADSINIIYNKIDFVGPQVGKELITKGLIALLLSFLVMLIYIGSRFEWEFGMGSVIALIHDVIIVFGVYSIFKLNFDLTSVAAILTIVGYSVNDKVVIYDRIREFTPKYKNATLTEIINRSLTTTLRRTLLTSSTTLLSLLILATVGGETLKDFSLIVFIGILVGTYSSIFISTPILIYIGVNKRKLK